MTWSIRQHGVYLDGVKVTPDHPRYAEARKIAASWALAHNNHICAPWAPDGDHSAGAMGGRYIGPQHAR